jgi:transposase
MEVQMLSQEKWVMIKSLFNNGMNKSDIAEYLGITRKTVSRHLKLDLSPKYVRTVLMESKLNSFYAYIDKRLEKYSLSSEKLYNEILAQGYTGKYGILNNYVKEKKKSLKTVAVLRFETLPGEQAQVDWGSFGSVYDKEQKRYIKLNCFFMILGYSRTLYIEFFDRANTSNFLLAHNNAFKYFGGYTREILYDNLKSVVIKRQLKAQDSEFNKKFMDFAGYYGFSPILCRPYKPNTKGKVENSVNYVKQNFFNGEEFHSLRDLNKKAQQWLEKANNRNHATTHEKPFDRLKREGLISIENKRLYDTSELIYRKVHKDCHFSYEGNKYSVPHKYAGKEVSIKTIENNTIKIIHRNIEIANHTLNIIDKGLYITNPKHVEELKEIRRTHGIRKPHKPKNKNNHNNLVLLKFNSIIPKVEPRDLSQYEEACLL